MIKDRQSLIILISALRIGLQLSGFHPETFPIDYFFKRWTNIEGQFSLIHHILKNSDVFCFADYPCLNVNIDALKSPPEHDSKDLANWRCLGLVEVLLSVSECGFYQQVQELFKFPVQNCPDILVLALLQCSGSVTLLRQDLLTNLIPIFLGTHANSAIILHSAWHAQTLNIKPIIMHSMAEWYARGECDQSRLSRILDVAQDLKALSMLLNAQNAQSYPFIIDLACLASRREYLKLEKWLTDKIREHGESFVQACIKFLQRRCPQIMGKNDDSLSKAAILPNETLTTMMMCLQACVVNVSSETQDAILSLAASCSLILKSRQQQPTAILRTHRTMEAPFNPTSISQQMYNPTNVDPITNIGNSLATMNLGGPANSAFSIPGGLGPLVQSPGSPSRVLGAAGPSNSPFPIIPMQHQGAVGGAVGTGAPLVPNVNLARMGPNQGLDKQARIDSTLSLFPEIAPNVSKDIEDEANSYFQRIYNHPPHPTLSIDEVLDMLKRFQESPLKREREVSFYVVKYLLLFYL